MLHSPPSESVCLLPALYMSLVQIPVACCDFIFESSSDFFGNSMPCLSTITTFNTNIWVFLGPYIILHSYSADPASMIV